TDYRGRIFIAKSFLVLAKLANVALPMVLKRIVDGMNPAHLPAGEQAVILPLALLLVYGVLRLGTVLFGEFRDLVFGRVTERAMRRVALQVFQHLHRLDLNFHLS